MFKHTVLKTIGATALTLSLAIGTLFAGITPALAAGQQAACRVKWDGLAPNVSGYGALITNVAAGSPAAKAGLKAGGIILQVGATDLIKDNTLDGLFASNKPGDKISLTVAYPGVEPMKMTVKLSQSSKDAKAPFLGVTSQNIPVDWEPFHFTESSQTSCTSSPFSLPERAEYGVILTQVTPDSPAAKAGLAQNDVLVAVNGKVVDNPVNLDSMIQAQKAGAEVTISLYRALDSKKTMQQIKVTLGTDTKTNKPFLGADSAAIIEADANTSIAYLGHTFSRVIHTINMPGLKGFSGFFNFGVSRYGLTLFSIIPHQLRSIFNFKGITITRLFGRAFQVRPVY